MAATKKQVINFSAGDVVVLKSGGPKMSVVEVRTGIDATSVQCTWFAGKKNEKGFFRPENLVLAPDADGDDEE